MRDIANNIGVVQAVPPAVLTATNTSAAIDLLGFESAALVISTGALVGAAVFVPKLQESDDGTTFTDVAAADLVGTFPASLAATSVIKVGYKGFKRYMRTVLTLTSGTSLAVDAVIVKGNALRRPAA
jgi:hypothetical protein